MHKVDVVLHPQFVASVIDHFVHFRRSIFNGAQISRRFSAVLKPNSTKFEENIGPSSMLTELVLDFTFLTPFRIASGSKVASNLGN